MDEISYSGSKNPIRRRISKRVVLFGMFFIIILLLLGSVAYFVTRGNSSDQVTQSITLPPDESESEVIEEEPSITPEESPEPTEEEEEEPTAAPTTTASAGSVAVQNGSGEEGVAGAGADTLRELGYDVVSTGNADNFEYENVTIQVKASQEDILPLLEEDLSESYTIGETSTDLPEDESFDALVIIGA